MGMGILIRMVSSMVQVPCSILVRLGVWLRICLLKRHRLKDWLGWEWIDWVSKTISDYWLEFMEFEGIEEAWS